MFWVIVGDLATLIWLQDKILTQNKNRALIIALISVFEKNSRYRYYSIYIGRHLFLDGIFPFISEDIFFLMACNNVNSPDYECGGQNYLRLTY